jgi:glycosyltransferase involved in cell wall biosynthesis
MIIELFFVSYKDNKGRGYARNVGLKKATGKIIVIWDIDDIYFPNRLEIIKNKINNYDFFASKAIIVDNDLNIKGVRGFDKNKLYTGFVHPTLAFSSIVKNSINYNEEMTAGEDFESMIFLTNNCKGFFYEEPLMLYVEDREVNLNKTLISNTSHLNTIIKVYNQKISKIDTFSYFFRVIKLKLKILILKTFKIYPKLYLFTIKYRDINTDPKEYKRYVPEINKLKTQLVK